MSSSMPLLDAAHEGPVQRRQIDTVNDGSWPPAAPCTHLQWFEGASAVRKGFHYKGSTIANRV
jgi:hypothetical protein